MKYPKIIENLIEFYSKFPGIGKKTAERLAMHTIGKFSNDDIEGIVENLLRIKTDIKNCKICGVITEKEICEVCSDDDRDNKSIMILEDSKDVFIIEKIGNYRGLYHVLGGLLSPIDGVGPEQLNLKELINRLHDEKVSEVIIALNASVEGETTAMYINKLLENTDINVTRIAHGLPVGGGIEHADDITLIRALEGRRKM